MSISTKPNLQYYSTINIPFGSLHTTVDWCQAYLEKDWQFDVIEEADHYMPGYYVFHFESAKDLTAFMLWQK